MTYLVQTLIRNGSSSVKRLTAHKTFRSSWRSMSTQSGDDAKKSPLLAKIHLEDGTTLLGRSFGSHESVDGEVRVFGIFKLLDL
jgi:hypothetical protein